MSHSDPHPRRPRLLRRPGRSLPRGYTLVEAMVTALVASIGFAALIDLQGNSLSTVRDAHDRTQAVAMGEHFVEMVRMRSHLCAIPDGSEVCAFLPPPGVQDGTWARYVRPDAPADLLTVSPGVYDGESPGDIDYGLSREFVEDRQLRYCIHYRTAWVVPDRLFRVDVRVMWPHADTNVTDFEDCALALADDSAAPLQVGHATVSTTIQRGGGL